jgi:L-cysteine:1D-myo-inositol 2-amino-2-deoxy-alpha-D-glucopyranoside ligase
MYVCGITPYDATHLGHAATYVAFDLLYRQWLDRGVDVTYVQNVTDIDDPLLERAKATGVDWRELASGEIDRFRDDMATLRILPPRQFVGVVESMPAIIELIGKLGDTTYLVGDDLYFEVRSADLGARSGLDDDAMKTIFGERGGDPDRLGKRHPLDCLLWRATPEGEPSWDSPWGRGRPGWHIECAAIAHAYLGERINVLGGGSDLAFPHHAMCAAETEKATGESAAAAYVHTAMVGYEGGKMAKSDGNLVFVSQLRSAGRHPMAVRLALLAHHYRGDWEWQDDEIVTAGQRLARWRDAVQRESTAPAQPVIDDMREQLAADLGAPHALAAVDAWCDRGGPAADGAALADAIDALLGVRL